MRPESGGPVRAGGGEGGRAPPRPALSNTAASLSNWPQQSRGVGVPTPHPNSRPQQLRRGHSSLQQLGGEEAISSSQLQAKAATPGVGAAPHTPQLRFLSLLGQDTSWRRGAAYSNLFGTQLGQGALCPLPRPHRLRGAEPDQRGLSVPQDCYWVRPHPARALRGSPRAACPADPTRLQLSEPLGS